MKIPSFLKSFSPIQIFFFVVFVTFIIFPIPISPMFAGYVDSSFGMIFMLCVTLFLFLYANPILAVTYIFFAYEALRRSSIVSGKTVLITVPDEPAVLYYPDTIKSVNSKTIGTGSSTSSNPYSVLPYSEPTLEEETVKKITPLAETFTGVSSFSEFDPLNSTAFSNAQLV